MKMNTEQVVKALNTEYNPMKIEFDTSILRKRKRKRKRKRWQSQ